MRLVLLLSVAAAAFAQTPAKLRLLYAVSGKPAAGVIVEVSREGKSTRYTADSAGRIDAAVSPGHVFITDPKTGTVLLSRGFSAEPKEIEVGIPIRLTGQVTGFGSDPSKIEIDCAYGERLTISDYERTVQKLDLRPRTNQDTVHGMAIPDLPGKSLRAHPDAAGRFTTGWIAAMEAPEVLVFGGPDALSGIKTVKLARSIVPGATIPAGTIAPSFGATLEIKVNAPKTDLPLGLLMRVDSLTSSAAAKARTAELLSAIHRQDVSLSQFLLQRRTIALNFEGVTTLRGLPPIQSLKLVFNGPTVGIRAERTVRIPERGVVRIELPAEELLGKEQPRVSYSGLVRFAGADAPVAGAKVVYSSYPDKYETTTGADGRFRFPGVSANRPGILFIDAPNPGGEPPFDRFTVSRPVAPITPAAANAEHVVDLPQPPAAPARALLGNLGDYNYTFNGCTSGYTQADLEFSNGPVFTIWEKQMGEFYGPVSVTFGDQKVYTNGSALKQITFPEPGDYEVYMELTPFVFVALDLTVKDVAQVVTFPAPSNMQGVTIGVLGKNNSPAPADVELGFTLYSPDLDSYAEVTNSSSLVNIACVTRSPNVQPPVISVEVDDPVSGYFEGELNLPTTGPTAQLTLKLGDKPTKTQASKSNKK